VNGRNHGYRELTPNQRPAGRRSRCCRRLREQIDRLRRAEEAAEVDPRKKPALAVQHHRPHLGIIRQGIARAESLEHLRIQALSFSGRDSRTSAMLVRALS